MLQIGSTIKDYKIISLLGKGKSGYSYLVQKDQQHYVLKKIHHEPTEYYQFGNKMDHEVSSYQKLLQYDISIPKIFMIDYEEEFILKEYIEGDALINVLAKGDIPYDAYLAFLPTAILLEHDGINIDYFPANFVLSGSTIYYIDYEVNHYMNKWNFKHWGCNMWFNAEGCKHFVTSKDESELVYYNGQSKYPEMGNNTKMQYDNLINRWNELNLTELE